MAWTSPRTWVAGEVVTAANMNTHVRDNMNALGLKTAWVPVLTATTTNPTLGTGGSQGGNYRASGGWCEVEGFVAFGTSGVAAGTGNYLLSVPVAPNPAGAGTPLGQCRILDSSATAIGIAHLLFNTSTTVAIVMPSSTTVGGFGTVGAASPMVWAASDRLDFHMAYAL